MIRALSPEQVDLLAALRQSASTVVWSRRWPEAYRRLAHLEYVIVEAQDGLMTRTGRFRTLSWLVKITDAGRDALRDTLPGQETWQEEPGRKEF